jgi:hypothetical protein
MVKENLLMYYQQTNMKKNLDIHVQQTNMSGKIICPKCNGNGGFK